MFSVPAFGLEAPSEDSLPPKPENNIELSSLSLGVGSNGVQWHLRAVDNEYNFSQEANNPVTIAILDSGVNRTSDLACHDFVNEYNAITNTAGPFSATDGNGHGTYVAEIIAGCLEGNDGRGIAAGVKIMPIKVLDDNGNGSMLALLNGIYWATINGADIINMSLGIQCYPYPNCPIWAFGWGEAYLNWASANGVLMVAASGNNAFPFVSWPAANPNVWAIGAVDETLNKSFYSNSGQTLKFVMPGDNIVTSVDTDKGTSMASPQAAAAAAILKGIDSNLSVKQIEDAFICTVLDLGDSGWDPDYGYGLIQINAAATLIKEARLQNPWWLDQNFSISSVENVEDQSISFIANWSKASDCNEIENYRILLNTEYVDTIDADTNAYKFKDIQDGKYTAEIIATNIFGNTTETLTTSFTVDQEPPFWPNDLINIELLDKTLHINWPLAEDLVELSEYVLAINKDTYRISSQNQNYKLDISNFEELDEISIEIYAVDISGNKSLSLSDLFIVPDITPPVYEGIPFIEVLEQTSNTISISWPEFTDVSGIKEYRLAYNSVNNEYISGEITTTENSFILNDLPDSAKYSFIIYVVDNEDNEIICCTKVVEAKDTIPPIWIDETNIGLNVNENLLLINWGEAEDNKKIDKYSLRIFVEGEQIHYVELLDTVNEYEFNLENLEVDGFISVKINAVDEDQNLSNSLIASLDFQPPSWIGEPLINLEIEDDNLTISWNNATDNREVKNYTISIYKNSTEEEVLIIDYGINLIEYDISDYSSNDEIMVQITASDGTNLSSQIMNSVTVPGFVSNVLNNLGITTTSTSSTSTSSTSTSSTSTSSTSTSSTSTSSTSTSSTSTSSTTTTTAPGITYTPTGSLSGNCPLLSSSTSATSPLFKQVNNNVYPFGPVESAFSGYEGCMYSGLSIDEIKDELVRYLTYWKQFDQNEFKYLNSVQSRNWRNDSALNAAVSRWGSEWSNVNPSSIVENLSRSDGQLVWDDDYWTVGITTTTLPTFSDPDTTNTVLGSPTIKSITITTVGSDYKAVIGFDLAPAVKDLEIVGHSCDYYANPSSGGTSGNFGVDTKTCELNVPQREQVSFKVAAKYGNYINCNEPNDPSTCVQIDNEQYGPYCEWVTVTLTGEGSISDSSVLFSWDGASTPTTTTTTSSTTTTTVPGDTTTTTTSTTTTTTSTTTTTLPPSNTTTTTVPCETLDEAKSLVLANWSEQRRCGGCVPKDKKWILDPSGSTTALVDGSYQTVSYVDFENPLQVGDTFLQGISWEQGYEFYTHTVETARSGQFGGGTALYYEVHSDAYVTREANNNYEICP